LIWGNFYLGGLFGGQDGLHGKKINLTDAIHERTKIVILMRFFAEY